MPRPAGQGMPEITHMDRTQDQGVASGVSPVSRSLSPAEARTATDSSIGSYCIQTVEDFTESHIQNGRAKPPVLLSPCSGHSH